jgi:hypothetical protein
MGYNRSHKNASEKFNLNIDKRGQVSALSKKKGEEEDLVGPKISPWIMGILLFVVFGR